VPSFLRVEHLYQFYYCMSCVEDVMGVFGILFVLVYMARVCSLNRVLNVCPIFPRISMGNQCDIVDRH
jgi:hypothetical protein